MVTHLDIMYFTIFNGDLTWVATLDYPKGCLT